VAPNPWIKNRSSIRTIDALYGQNTVTGAKKIRKTNAVAKNFVGVPLRGSQFLRQYSLNSRIRLAAGLAPCVSKVHVLPDTPRKRGG
jgi:hypothetical protein